MSLDFLFRTGEFRDLVRAVAAGESPLSVHGVIDPARAYVLTCLAREVRRPVVFIRPASAPLAALEEECRFFVSRLAPALRLSVLPPLADNPYFEVPPALEAVSSRMRLFRSLLGAPPSIVITTLAGLLKPVPAREDLERLFLTLEVGAEIEHGVLLETLAQYGYTREDLIASPGEYAWRGGIVDVFAPGEVNPFRVELDGAKVASLREFDISSQRSLKKVERLTVPGLREYPATPDFLGAWESAARKRSRGTGRDLDAKIAALRRGEFGPAFPALALVEKDRFVPLTDHLRDGLFVVDRPEVVEKEWEESQRELRDQFADLLADRVFALPLP